MDDATAATAGDSGAGTGDDAIADEIGEYTHIATTAIDLDRYSLVAPHDALVTFLVRLEAYSTLRLVEHATGRRHLLGIIRGEFEIDDVPWYGCGTPLINRAVEADKGYDYRRFLIGIGEDDAANDRIFVEAIRTMLDDAFRAGVGARLALHGPAAT